MLNADASSILATAAGFTAYSPSLFARPVAIRSAIGSDAQAVPAPYTAAEILSAYVGPGYNGAQQTIAIVVAGDDPTIAPDLASFDTKYKIQPANFRGLHRSEPESAGDSSFDSHFDRPGVSFFAPAGDNAASVPFPAVSPYVTGVVGNVSNGPPVGDAGFENVPVGSGAGAYVYDPTGSAWTFGG